MTTPVTNNTGTNNTTGSGSTAAKTGTAALQDLSKDFENFLTLLTTQLQNQDPTQPMDTSQMTSQIAQLSMVQAQATTNQTLQNLLTAYNDTQTSSTVGYIGKRVEGTGNTSVLQNGTAEFVYNLDDSAASATVTIKDSNGNVVYTGNGSTDKGRNVVFWTGVNSTTGAQQADGAYTYTVTAKDNAGNNVNSTTYTTGQVTGVLLSNGTPTLDLGNGLASMALSDVTRVEGDPLASVGTGTNTGTNSGTNTGTGTDSATNTNTNTNGSTS